MTERHPATHPATKTWAFPPADRAPLPAPCARTNLRELEARPDRFEHHLMVVAQIGSAQLEVATASEPLYFAHGNISDEYALAMTTGDAMVDVAPFLTLLSDRATGADVGRLKHRAGDLVLHPHGWLHWPGRLRPPYRTFEFAPGLRRCTYSLVYCACAPTPPSPERPAFVSAGREADAKPYAGSDVPLVIAQLDAEPARTVAAVGDTTLQLVIEPSELAPGYTAVLSGDAPHFPGDLIYVPAGERLPVTGITRALVFSSPSRAPEPPPPSWTAAPPPPFPVFEDGEHAELPALPGLPLALTSDTTITVAGAEIPRYWLARMLFRTALHGHRLGYLETYGGFTYDDTDGIRLGLRGGPIATVEPATIEQLYRAIAPPGYLERLR